MPDSLDLENTMEEQDDTKYAVCKCHKCQGRLLVAEYSATVNMRIDGKLHPIGVRRVPCQRCEDCGTATMDSSSDEYYAHAYQRYINEKGMNTWRHRLYRVIMRRLRLLESWFYRGPMWQWRRRT
jgi:hypothetical protein